MNIVPDNATKLIRAGTADDVDAVLSYSALDTVVDSAGQTTVTEDDRTFERHSPATVARTAIIALSGEYDHWRTWEFTPPLSDEDAEFDPSTGIITPSESTTGGTGTAKVIFKTPSRNVRIDIPCNISTGQTIDVFTEFVEGSMCRDIMDTSLAAIGDPAGQNRFTLYSEVPEQYERNNARWFSNWEGELAISLRCGNNLTQTVALVHEQFVIGCAHYPPDSPIRFMDKPGNLYLRNIVSRTDIAGTDIQVCLLDEALPGGVPPMAVMGPDALLHLTQQGKNIVVFRVNQQRKFVIHEVINIDDGGVAIERVPQDAAFSPYYISPIPGDSGSPYFFAFNGDIDRLVLYRVFGGGANNVIMENIDAINTAMDAALTSASLTTFDLSGFPTY
jgi:hypothetical protein